MYTAEILSTEKEQGDVLPLLVVTVKYSKDGMALDLPNLKPIRTAEYDRIKEFIAQQIATFEKQDAINAAAANPEIGNVDLTPARPDQSILDCNNFFKAVNKLRQIDELEKLGVDISSIDKPSAIKDVQERLKAEYLG